MRWVKWQAMGLALVLLLLFITFAFLMYLNKLPALLALPLMAVIIGFVARVPFSDILTIILAEGAGRLHQAMIVVFFGAMLGEFIHQAGIAETMVRKVAELAGDRPFVIASSLVLIIALLFTTLGGLGAVIMVATILIPILLSIGIPPVIAAGLFLMGLSLGGTFNFVNWQLYMSVLGLSQGEILKFAVPFSLLMFFFTLLFFAVEIRRTGRYALCSTWEETNTKKDAPLLSLATPIVPIALILGFSLYNVVAHPEHPFEFPIVAAILGGLLYGVVTMLPQKVDPIQLISKSMIEGIRNVAPATALIMGIGILLNSVTHPAVAETITPLIRQILPRSSWQYVLFFALLSPLTLYRGPLNIWGMGSGLIAIMVASQAITPIAIMAALLAVGQIQGVCDPTNTHNVWLANFLNVNVQDILKKTFPYMWALALAGLLLASVWLFV